MHPDDRRYSIEHEWAQEIGDGTVVLGLTHYAQEHLGDVVFLELPPAGTMLSQSQKLGEVESVKSVSDIFSPVSGEVVEVNDAVVGSPELVNEDPHGTGWLLKVRLAQPAELDTLMTSSKYETFLESLDQ